MIRNIYILLLLSLSFGTVYGMQVVINGTYSITGQDVGSDMVQFNHPEQGWQNASYSYIGFYSIVFVTDSPAGTVVELRLQSGCCGELTTGTCTGDTTATCTGDNCMGENPPSVATQDNNIDGGGPIAVNLEFTYSPEYILGDINGDGYLDVLDIVMAVDLILNGNYDVVADVNEDGQLDVLDVVMLLNWVLNGEPSLCDGLTEVELWGVTYDIETTTEINLINQGLTGSIPPEIGCLTNLIFVDLGDNILTGEIPPEIGQLTNLYVLYLYNNQLTGEIPSEIGNLTNLTKLALAENQLTGEIPPEIGNLTSLIYLYLSSNQLTGEIPQEVCDLIESNDLPISNILSGNNLINTCD